MVLRADAPGVAPVVDPYGTVVLQMDRSHVDTVLVAGTGHKVGGRVVRDPAELIEGARSVVGRPRSEGLFTSSA